METSTISEERPRDAAPDRDLQRAFVGPHKCSCRVLPREFWSARERGSLAVAPDALDASALKSRLFEQTAEFARVQEEFWEASAATQAEAAKAAAEEEKKRKDEEERRSARARRRRRSEAGQVYSNP